MAKVRHHITVTERGGTFTASLAGCSTRISSQDSAEKAIGLLVMVLSYPLGISIGQHYEEKED